VPSRDYLDCPALHAEANALLVGDRRDRVGGTLYTTAHVCQGCAKLIANSGIVRVVVGADDPAEWRRSPAAYEMLMSLGILVTLR
jgi:deoxycytidylate deaminase